MHAVSRHVAARRPSAGGGDAARRRALEVPPRAGGSAGGASFGMTLTATFIVWPRPPRMTPRSGTTSAKSAPLASVM